MRKNPTLVDKILRLIGKAFHNLSILVVLFGAFMPAAWILGMAERTGSAWLTFIGIMLSLMTVYGLASIFENK